MDYRGSSRIVVDTYHLLMISRNREVLDLRAGLGTIRNNYPKPCPFSYFPDNQTVEETA